MERKNVLDISRLGGGIEICEGRVIPYYTHTHMYFEMLVYESFEGHICVNGEAFSIDEATVVIVAPSAFHSTHAAHDERARYLKISFGEEVLDESLKSSLAESVILRGYRSSRLAELLVERLRGFDGDLAGKRILLNALLLEICECSRIVVHGDRSRTASLVIESERMICRNFCGDITIESAARELHVSVPHLSKSFKKHMGLGFCEYLTEIRLRFAYSLLAEGELDVTEVCYACGFRNLSHFIRSFKRRYGLTPGKKRGERGTGA